MLSRRRFRSCGSQQCQCIRSALHTASQPPLVEHTQPFAPHSTHTQSSLCSLSLPTSFKCTLLLACVSRARSLSRRLSRRSSAAMSAPNGSKGSQGRFGERYLGINRLTPPATHDATAADLPMSITLGQYSLQLDSHTGQWKLQEGLIATLQQQVSALQQQLAMAQKETALVQQQQQQAGQPSIAGADGLEWERRLLEVEKANIQLLNDNGQLRFKAKVLTAMCAIAEGDYQRLCDEVGVENDSSVRRVNSGVAAGSGGGSVSDGRGKAGAEYSFTSTVNAGLGEMKREGSFSRTQRYESSNSEHERTIKAPMRYQMQAGAV